MSKYSPRSCHDVFLHYYLQFIFHESSHQSTLLSLDTDSVITNQQDHEPILTATENESTPYKHILMTSSFSYKNVALAARSKVWTVFALLNAGIVGSNLTQGMDVCVRLFCLGSAPETGRTPVQGVLQAVYRIKKLNKWPRSTRAVKPPKKKKEKG
jgi:hypothetical protein